MQDFTPKPCPEWAEKLAATYPEDLSDVDLKALDAHVATCPECRAIRDEYRFLDTRVRDIPDAKLQPRISFSQLLARQREQQLRETLGNLYRAADTPLHTGVPPRAPGFAEYDSTAGILPGMFEPTLPMPTKYTADTRVVPAGQARLLRVPRPRRKPLMRLLNAVVAIIIVSVLILLGTFLLPLLGHYGAGHYEGSRPVSVNGITAYKAADGEYIGISDGTFAFDTNRADGHLKAEAAEALKAGDTRTANAYWNLGIAEDRTGAEARIYQENLSVLASHSPYLTFVVVTTLTGSKYSTNAGRDTLQGAYIAQKEYNDNHKLSGGVQVRLLIANIGNPSTDAMTVAQQIVHARQADKTIVGVMGWPFGSDIDAIKHLAANHIPMVSPTASGDALIGISSPYFFSVAPSIKSEAVAGAKYAEQTLHATKAALFYDPVDPYSSNLATDFRQQFAGVDGNTVLVKEYTTGHPEALQGLVHDVMSGNPDLTLIYFAGYPEDARLLLQDVHSSWPQVQVMGGDALYQLIHSPGSERADFNGLYMTAFAYPDEWKVLDAPEPPFFNDYSQTFDPLKQQVGNPYGHTRADNDVILSYDATLALLSASSAALTEGKSSLTPQELQQALTKITGSQSLLGASGQVSFGPDGHPEDKAVVVLYVAPEGIQLMRMQEGRYR